jgi:hypothetical protein
MTAARVALFTSFDLASLQHPSVRRTDQCNSGSRAKDRIALEVVSQTLPSPTIIFKFRVSPDAI